MFHEIGPQRLEPPSSLGRLTLEATLSIRFRFRAVSKVLDVNQG